MLNAMNQSRTTSPTHLKLYQKIAQRIREGTLPKGELLPSDQELAEEHGVSRYMARRVYSELVRDGLVQRVRKRGTMVTYDPATAKLRKVGLILVADVPAYYLFEKGVEDVLGDRGAGLFVQYHFDSDQRSEAAFQEALEHGVEGLIVSPPPHGSLETPFKLAARGFPIVLALVTSDKISCVYPDDHRTGFLMGDHFGAQGFKRPVALGQDQTYAENRIAGFREGLARHKVRLLAQNLIEIQYEDENGEYLEDMGRREVDCILAMKQRPDSIFAVNDSTAIAIHYWLNQRGLRVPEDMAVAGVDNLGRKFHPFPLTSVDIGLEAMGRAAAEAMLRQLERPRTPAIFQRIEPKLVVSRSTARG